MDKYKIILEQESIPVGCVPSALISSYVYPSMHWAGVCVSQLSLRTVNIHILQLLPPANEVWGKVISLQVSVIHSVHRGGGGYPSMQWANSI